MDIGIHLANLQRESKRKHSCFEFFSPDVPNEEKVVAEEKSPRDSRLKRKFYASDTEDLDFETPKRLFLEIVKESKAETPKDKKLAPSTDEEMEVKIRDQLLDELPKSPDDNVTSEQSENGQVEVKDQDRKVIIMKGELPNLALPDGWLALNHRSGGIIYLHRPTRVVTWGRPYHISNGSARKHDVPVAAIPCLHQKRALVRASSLCNPQENVSTRTVLNFLNTVGSTLEGETISPSPSTQLECQQMGKLQEEETPAEIDGRTNNESLKSESNLASNITGSGLDVIDAILEEKEPCRSVTTHSCSSDSSTKQVNNLSTNDHFTRVVDSSNVGYPCASSSLRDYLCLNRRNNNVYSKSGIKLIDSDGLSSYLSAIYEFQKLSKEQEQNVFVTSPESTANDATLPPILESLPFSVKGVDMANNKGSKDDWVINPGGKTPVAILHEYAQRVLKVKPDYVCSECESPATPFMAEVCIDGITHGKGMAASKKQARQLAAESALEVFMPHVFKKIRDYEISQDELQFFEEIKIEDPKISEVSVKAGLPSPSQILQDCLKRNQGLCSSDIDFQLIPGPNQQHTYTMTCAERTVEGLCKNKKIGRQLASQAILQKLHPHISTWGALLRIYCDRPLSVVKKCKEEDELMSRPESLTTDVPRGELLLERLKQEMRKLHQVPPSGTTGI